MSIDPVGDEFPISLQNIPPTFTAEAPLAELVDYFLNNPDISTAVLLDSRRKVSGVITRNDLLRHFVEKAGAGGHLKDLAHPPQQAQLTGQVGIKTVSDHVKNNFEDLIVVDGQNRYQCLTTCFELAKLLIKEHEKGEDRYRAFLDSALHGIVAVDLEARVVFLNQAACRMLEVSHREALGRPVADIIPDSRLPQVLKTGRPKVNERHRIGEHTFFTNRTPVKLDGQLIGALAQFVNVPNLDGPLEELADAKGFVGLMEMVLDNAYVGLIFCDSDGIIRFMNRLYEELLGISREETYGKHITEYFPDSRLPIVIRTGQAEWGWKYTFQGKKTLVVNRIPIKKRGRLIGVIAQCIFRDISELKDMARKLDLLESKVRDYETELKDLLAPQFGFKDILGHSEAITRVKHLAELYAQTDAPVLVTGETGTGKELFAHAIHGASPHSTGPFICLNCAAIPAELVESELFGYAPGAFTGAHRQGKIGKIELAQGGTLFLDEIGDLPIQIQAKLLRVIEQKVVERLGSVHPAEVNFRLVAATNRDLTAMISEKKFREDLYYRLGTMVLTVPPLRNRAGDIPVLARHFIKQGNRDHIEVSAPALKLLMNHEWRGNVRELKSVIERSMILVENGSVIGAEHLSAHVAERTTPADQAVDASEIQLKKVMQTEERETIIKALQMCGGNKAGTARMLGISRSLLYNKLKRHRIG